MYFKMFLLTLNIREFWRSIFIFFGVWMMGNLFVHLDCVPFVGCNSIFSLLTLVCLLCFLFQHSPFLCPLNFAEKVAAVRPTFLFNAQRWWCCGKGVIRWCLFPYTSASFTFEIKHLLPRHRGQGMVWRLPNSTIQFFKRSGSACHIITEYNSSDLSQGYPRPAVPLDHGVRTFILLHNLIHPVFCFRETIGRTSSMLHS